MTVSPEAATVMRPVHREIELIEGAAQRFEVPYLGRRVCWRRWGSGPNVVLVHGGHGNWTHWIRNISALAERHTVWAPDLPGFGDSDDLPCEPHDPALKQHLVDALVTTLDAVAGRDAIVDLAGFSFGGLIATEVASQRDRVRRLALIGPAGHGGARQPHPALRDWRRADSGERREIHRHNLGAFMLHRPSSIDELAIRVHQIASEKTRFRSKAISRAGGLSDALNRCLGPVLLVWGSHDVTAVPADIAPSLAAGESTRDWVVIPDSGHWVQFEDADLVNKLLTSWFGTDMGDKQ